MLWSSQCIAAIPSLDKRKLGPNDWTIFHRIAFATTLSRDKCHRNWPFWTKCKSQKYTVFTFNSNPNLLMRIMKGTMAIFKWQWWWQRWQIYNFQSFYTTVFFHFQKKDKSSSDGNVNLEVMVINYRAMVNLQLMITMVTLSNIWVTIMMETMANLQLMIMLATMANLNWWYCH